ncbi:hypothetical protein MEO93_28115, partial [Dolichospermum sp. ST_sed3]|nr:hypothetical protein [Dolichospermum sp. ST_sed3]
VLTNILSDIPPVKSSINMPFTLSKISISVQFTKYFSLMFIIVIDILASMVLGLVSKGEEREGLKFLPAILIMSISVFYISRFFVANFLGDLL